MCLREALKLLGVDNVLDTDKVLGVEERPVLVGGGTDGAAVNVGEHSGLKGQLQHALPWLFWSWCYAHCLELVGMRFLVLQYRRDAALFILPA